MLTISCSRNSYYRGGKRLLEKEDTLTEKATAAEQTALNRYHCTEMDEELKT
jgi:hypothetical protein